MTILGNRLARSLEGVGVALLIARPLAAQARACSPLASDSLSAQSTARWTCAARSPRDRARDNALAARRARSRRRDRRSCGCRTARSCFRSTAPSVSRPTTSPVGRVLAESARGTNVAAVGVGGDQVVLAPRRDTPAQPAEPRDGASLGVLDRVVVTGSATTAASGARAHRWTERARRAQLVARQHEHALRRARRLRARRVELGAVAVEHPELVRKHSRRELVRLELSEGLHRRDRGREPAARLALRIPSSIDRIEVIRGPQGSALYGTDAISGVVNIVTRHEGAPAEGERDVACASTAGVIAERLTRRSNALYAESRRSRSRPARAPSRQTLHVSGGTTGAFIPDGYSRDLMATAARASSGSEATLSGTARLFVEEAGSAPSPSARATLAAAGASATRRNVAAVGLASTRSERPATISPTSDGRIRSSPDRRISTRRTCRVELHADSARRRFGAARRAGRRRSRDDCARAASISSIRVADPRDVHVSLDACPREHSALR